MRAMVTGGAGFIGSHLVERLLDDGHQVVAVDNLSTGSRDNILPFLKQESFLFVEGSVVDGKLVGRWMAGCDAVFHLAAAVGVMLIVRDPVGTIEDNVMGSASVLQAACRQPVPPRVFIASSSEIYGRSEAVPFSEGSDVVYGPTTRSRWSYACSKAVAEQLALAYYKTHRLPAVIGRFFNVVGPRQSGAYGMVLPRFVRQAMEGGPIEVFGDGRQTRCFLHVREAVDAMMRLALTPSAAGRVFNIGSTEEIAIEDLALRVRQRVNPAAAIRLVPYDEAYEEGFEDLARRVPDLGRIRAAIGFEPAIGIDRIIDEVAEDIRHSTSCEGSRP